jgi:hypothetical protein
MWDRVAAVCAIAWACAWLIGSCVVVLRNGGR